MVSVEGTKSERCLGQRQRMRVEGRRDSGLDALSSLR